MLELKFELKLKLPLKSANFSNNSLGRPALVYAVAALALFL